MNKTTGICPFCRRTFSLNNEGLLRKHGRGLKCEGSHKAPAPDLVPSQQQQTPSHPISQSIETDTNESEKHFGGPVHTIRFLPRNLVPLAAEHLSAALRRVSDHPHDQTAWWSLLLWPRRLVECTESRKLPRKTRNEQLRAQITGERAPPKPDPRAREDEHNHDANTLRRDVRRKIDAGQVNNAMKLIINDGKLIPLTDTVLTALKEKHPPASNKQLPTLSATSQPIIIDREMINAAVQSMNIASAAGPDGLRPSLLRQLVGKEFVGSRDKILDSLQSFAATCVAGKVPSSISKFFFGATLCALRKKDGKVRPIAVGCVIRRIISKAACHAVRERASKLLSPIQLGIGIADGATAAAHAARRFLSACKEGEKLLKLDFKNAFNAIERSQVLTAVLRHFPELAPFTFAAYTSPSWLFFGQYKLESAQGVQQGDPLGHLFYSPSQYTKQRTHQIADSPFGTSMMVLSVVRHKK